MSNLFGITGGSQNSSKGSSSGNSSSSNLAYPMLSNALGSTVTQGVGAGNQLGNMLGLNGTQGQSDAFKNWQNSTGYQFGLNQGQQSINGNAATTGLLNSGSTAKALETYGQNYADTQYGNYTGQLQNLLNGGLQAGNTISGAGNVSQSQQQANNSSKGVDTSRNGSLITNGIGMLLGK